MNKKWPLDKIENLIVRNSNYGLLVVLLTEILVIPILENPLRNNLMDLGIILIILLSLGAVSKSSTRRGMIQLALLAVASWFGSILDIPLLKALAYFVVVLFMLRTIVIFIKNLASKSAISVTIMIEAINGYLLLGLGFSLIVSIISLFDQQAFTFSATLLNDGIINSNYFTFVTLATLGYGDLLPATPYAKSIAIFIALCGQIYQVTIMAFIMGKLVNNWQKNNLSAQKKPEWRCFQHPIPANLTYPIKNQQKFNFKATDQNQFEAVCPLPDAQKRRPMALYR